MSVWMRGTLNELHSSFNTLQLEEESVIRTTREWTHRNGNRASSAGTASMSLQDMSSTHSFVILDMRPASIFRILLPDACNSSSVPSSSKMTSGRVVKLQVCVSKHQHGTIQLSARPPFCGQSAGVSKYRPIFGPAVLVNLHSNCTHTRGVDTHTRARACVIHIGAVGKTHRLCTPTCA
jgi:hypothetical protein